MTKLFRKRLELLHLVGEVKESEKSFYVVLNTTEVKKEFHLTALTISKHNINRINTQDSYIKKKSEMIILTKTNKLLYKKLLDKGFSPLVLGKKFSFSSNKSIVNLVCYNKKAEWIKNEDCNLIPYFNFLKSFSSWKEVCHFLGCTFPVDCNFTNLNLLLTGYKFKNKHNVLNSKLLEDTINMIETLNLPIYYESNKTIENLHSELILLTNSRKLELMNKDIILPTFYKKYKEILENLEVEILNSEYLLGLEGMKQKHCVGSMSYYLDQYLFFNYKGFTFKVDDEKIIECKGICNSTVPSFIKEEINSQFKFKQIENNFHQLSYQY